MTHSYISRLWGTRRTIFTFPFLNSISPDDLPFDAAVCLPVTCGPSKLKRAAEAALSVSRMIGGAALRATPALPFLSLYRHASQSPQFAQGSCVRWNDRVNAFVEPARSARAQPRRRRFCLATLRRVARAPHCALSGRLKSCPQAGFISL